MGSLTSLYCNTASRMWITRNRIEGRMEKLRIQQDSAIPVIVGVVLVAVALILAIGLYAAALWYCKANYGRNAWPAFYVPGKAGSYYAHCKTLK